MDNFATVEQNIMEEWTNACKTNNIAGAIKLLKWTTMIDHIAVQFFYIVIEEKVSYEFMKTFLLKCKTFDLSNMDIDCLSTCIIQKSWGCFRALMEDSRIDPTGSS